MCVILFLSFSTMSITCVEMIWIRYEVKLPSRKTEI